MEAADKLSIERHSVQRGRIDVHAHYLPTRYREEIIAAGHSHPDGMPFLPEWDIAQALDLMDCMQVQTQMLSISSPGVHFGDDTAARKLSRFVNEQGAQAMRDYPERFGLFASLPLPDVDGALLELEHVFDVLKADGIVLKSNFHGLYPGDPKFEPLFAELNRRRAIVFLHPTSPACPCCHGSGLGYPRPTLEFIFETTRAVTNLILNGVVTRHPNIRFIVPHAGAALPLIVDRVIGSMSVLGLPRPLSGEEILADIRSLYFDLAGYPVPRGIPALFEIADQSHVMYGSDWPFTPRAKAEKLAEALDATPTLAGALRDAIMRGNALELFPRLKARD
ncbi:amidohydrolase family protein [Paraburkholderia sp. BCC1884]|uniref:amidohydrolase family protein n=1 Tax=Paraburkholderia sp. BCC1884 TaxID=2562668 RepID=UPI0011844270|nr:amidohydrolase family protein [Paraburkholderia sp. BCC1884]